MGRNFQVEVNKSEEELKHRLRYARTAVSNIGYRCSIGLRLTRARQEPNYRNDSNEMLQPYIGGKNAINKVGLRHYLKSKHRQGSQR
jgi:hypothetical protein